MYNDTLGTDAYHEPIALILPTVAHFDGFRLPRLAEKLTGWNVYLVQGKYGLGGVGNGFEVFDMDDSKTDARVYRDIESFAEDCVEVFRRICKVFKIMRLMMSKDQGLFHLDLKLELSAPGEVNLGWDGLDEFGFRPFLLYSNADRTRVIPQGESGVIP